MPPSARPIARPALMAVVVLALVTLAIKTFIEWRLHQSRSADTGTTERTQ